MDPTSQIKKMLEDALKKKQDAKSAADFKEVSDSLVREIAGSIAPDDVSNAVVDRLTKSIQPVLTQLLEKQGANSADITKAIREIQINIPETKIPNFPTPTVHVPAPIVNIPAPIVNVPPFPKIPEFPAFPSEMSLKAGARPFPVIMTDMAGKPMQFPGGATGGRADFFAIRDIQTSSGASIIDQVDGALKVVGSFSVAASNNSTQAIDSSGLPIGTAANPLNVVFSASASSASALVDSGGVQYSGSNPVPVTNIGLPQGQGDSATAQRVIIAGDSVSSVVVNSGTLTAVTSITNSVAASLIDSSGIGYSGSNPLPITGPVVVTSITNTTAANIVDSGGVVYSGSNPIPITWVSGAGATIGAANIDSSGVQYSGSNPFPFTLVTNATATLNVALTDSGGVQYSGSNPLPIVGPIVVTSVTNTIAAASIDSSGVQYSGTNPFPFTLVTSATATLNVALTDSGGIQYSGSNPVPFTLAASSASNSINAVIVDSSGIGFNGTNPVPVTLANTGSTQNVNMIGGGNDSAFTFMARTTLPTAVADGADVRPKADKLGRTLTRPIQVRDLIATAYVSVTTGTELTLISAVAGNFLDCIMLTATNQSTAATQLDIRATTAGNIVHTMYLPASTGPVGWALPVPWPQDNQGNNWTVDLPDITGTTVNVTALFSKEL